jgi:hypothetical protein
MRTDKYYIGSECTCHWYRRMDHYLRIWRYGNNSFKPYKHLHRHSRNRLFVALDDHQCPMCGFHGRCKHHLQTEPDNRQCRT